VLEGFVKLFCGNVDGEEAVLQIIGSGRGIIETSVLLDAPFPTGAKVVESAKILSIPSSIVRECIKNNGNLANNMLSTVANSSKELLNQLSQLSLKTVQERVGWFLLNLSLENERAATSRVSSSFELPYDKALIASYLGMKPETLSRALQSLKEEGSVSVERDTVKLSEKTSLCKYCDSETETKCKRHNTSECPNE
jgi:CRP-like cAMP-binding protein